MATETETVIFKVDTSEYETSLANLTKDINALKDAQKRYAEETKKGIAGAAEDYEAVTAQIKVTQQQYRTTQAVLVGYTATQKKAIDLNNLQNNSIQQNRDLLKQLTAQYINTKNPSEKFTKQIKDISDALKKQESEIGDNRRNVGAYAEGFKSAFSELSSGVPALAAFKKGQEGVNLALSANPIGAIVTLLIAFKDLLLGNAEAADQLSFVMGAVNKVFTALTDNLVEVIKLVGTKLGEAFNNPKQALIDFGKAINENITNRFKSIQVFGESVALLLDGEFSKAAKKAGDAVIQLSTGVTDGTTKLQGYANGLIEIAAEGYNAASALDALNEQQAILNGEATLLQKQADALVKSLKDRTKSEQERIAIANRAADLEIRAADKLAQAKKAELDAENERLKGLKISGQEAANLRILEFDVQIALQEKATIEAQRQTRINILLDKEASQKKIQAKFEEAKSLDDIFKKQAEDEKKRIADSIERELDAVVKREQLIARRIGSVSALVNAELIARARLLQNEALGEIERQNIIRESEDRILDIKKRASQETEKLQERELQNYQNQQQRVVDAVGQISNAVVNILGQASQFINQIAQENIDSLNEQLEAGVISQKTFDAETSALKLKAWKESKAIAITQASMNTANAVMAQLSNPTPYVGIVLAALAAATGAINIALIARQQPPKFAEGGKVIDIDGKPHSQGGTPIHVNGRQVAEAEKDEGLFIMKKNAYQKLKNYSDWNVAHGGNSWGVKTSFAALGGMVSDGGFTTREIANEANNAAMLSIAVREGLRSMPNPIVSVQEIDRVNNIRTKSVKVSQIG